MALHPTRRRLLAAVGAGASVGLSGCLGSVVPDVDEVGDALVAELWIYDRESDDSEPVADTHQDHWHGSLPTVQRGSVLSLGGVFKTHDREPIPIGTDQAYQLQARCVDDCEHISVDSHGDHVQIAGKTLGEAEIVFQLAEGDEPNWEAPPISITVPST